jgi:hypothetical protein
MTIETAIARVDRLRPNSVEDKDKIAWLSSVDGLVHREIILAHEHGAELDSFSGYDDGTDRGTELLAPFPYDELYIHWLCAQIDYVNMELDKYNNDRALFNNDWETFGDAWRRTHMPVQRNRELRI